MSKIFPFLTRTRRGLIPARPPTSIKRESKNSGCFQSFLSYPFLQQPHHHTVHNEAPDGAPIDPKLMRIQRTTSPRPKVPQKELVFGKVFSDHMLEIDWDYKNGWHPPVISAYHPLSLSPAASVLHYALECFEGMKA
ncbi:branched-chain-amino-acid aminotransferase [Nannochloropsis gaditana]|uniref:Branched-chain-amino-acid aminotransferase n=1 Tax=Nannochloropsis gaditana TaxID=72520 RepID=W7T6U9_9STRA|nr:branched-chain-amino-acid aminotransferase [Nannochloropsis gaditana]